MKIITDLGYEPKGFGFVKIIGEIEHYVTPYGNPTEGMKYELFGYHVDDEDGNHRLYDSYMISLTDEELIFLIKIFEKHQ